MIKIFIFIFLIFYIYGQIWHSEVNGYDTKEPYNGYSGIYRISFTDFYLCSERKYRVHYFQDNPLTWSQEFTACQPAGVEGRLIDGITVSGGLTYMGRTEGSNWLGEVTGYDITEFYNGYSGTLKSPLCGFLIKGKEIYRSGHNLTYGSSNENYVAKNVINNLFQKEETTFSYDKEIEIHRDSMLNITVLLLNTSKLNFDGDILIQVEVDKVIDANYDRLISDKLKKHIYEAMNFDLDQIKNYVEDKFFANSLRNGTVSINFNWFKKLIEIDTGCKLQSNHYSYRGGFRINIRLNEIDALLPKIQKLLKVLYKYKGRKIPEELLSRFNCFEKIEDIINDLDVDAVIAQEIIFYFILSYVVPYD